MTSYVVTALTVLFLFASLAVDLGRVQLSKTQLQAATDGAARYAVVGLRSTMMQTSGAAANADAVFAANSVDGQRAPFNAATDLQIGNWSAASRTFTSSTDASTANAVRITTSLVLGDSSHPLTFLSMFGKRVTIRCTSIATMSGQDQSTYVSAKGNPWLAGMPPGTMSTNFRSNPAEQDTSGSGPNIASSPALISISTMGINAGKTMTFDGVTGGANNGPVPITSNADGDATRLINLGSPDFGSYANFNSPTNGMSNCHAPINSLMAVFLGDADPSASAAPASLDFGTTSSRDFATLSPDLKQVFFVGDGRRDGGEIQQFVVPPGATRLFIANMDGWQYNDNVGGFNITVHATQTITSVLMN